MRPRIEQPTVKLILMELETGPATDRDLAPVIGIHYKNVRRTLNEMNKAKMVYISGWERKQGHPIAVWSIGSKRNGNKLKPLPGWKTTRRWREKINEQREKL